MDVEEVGITRAETQFATGRFGFPKRKLGTIRAVRTVGFSSQPEQANTC